MLSIRYYYTSEKRNEENPLASIVLMLLVAVLFTLTLGKSCSIPMITIIQFIYSVTLQTFFLHRLGACIIIPHKLNKNKKIEDSQRESDQLEQDRVYY